LILNGKETDDGKREEIMTTSMSGRERYRTNKQDLSWTEEQAHQNVGDMERKLSGLIGGVLLVTGLFRRSWGGAIVALTGAALLQRGLTGHCMIYQALDANTNELGRRKVRTGSAIKLQKTIRIERPPEELYRFWRNFENLPQIMTQIESVEVINDRLSHWVAKPIPLGGPKMEWDAEVINEIDNELIGWRSLRGADVESAGSVRFERTFDGRATDLTVTLQYALPGGRFSAWAAKLVGEDPEQKIGEDLKRFKETMEAQAHSSL
jgi:uncharacterized membrane protein